MKWSECRFYARCQKLGSDGLAVILLAIKPVTSKSNTYQKEEVEEYGDYKKKNEQYHKRKRDRAVRF